MEIIQAIKFRIYPNKEQQYIINCTLGCCRYIYNHMLDRNIKAYKRRGEHLSYITMQNLLPKMKKYLPWLKEVDSQALKYACRQLDTAYKKFFKHEAGFPKFHKKSGRQAYTTTNATTIYLHDKSIKIPVVGLLKARGIRPLPDNAKICYATVSLEPDGKYYISVTYKYQAEEPPVAPKDINNLKFLGLDYKSDGLYMDSEFRTADMPHWYRKSQAKLAREQRKLSRKQGSRKGEKKSYGWKKQHKKVARLHRKIAHQREDFLHKLSKTLADTYDVIAIENINMKTISNKGFGNGKATMDNGYGKFTTFLKQKLDRQRKQLIKVDKWYPSSQICSCCGYRNKELKNLQIRKWECPRCGVKHDRDHNAAVNIRNEAIRLLAMEAAA